LLERNLEVVIGFLEVEASQFPWEQSNESPSGIQNAIKTNKFIILTSSTPSL
jgi:hypothetical protein